MALIACNECGNQISDKAKSCPHCGNPLHVGIEKGGMPGIIKFLIVIALLAFFVIVLFKIMPQATKQQVKSTFNQAVDKPVTLYNKEDQVQEDQSENLKINLQQAKTLMINYHIKSGPDVDVYLLDADNYSRYKRTVDGENTNGFKYYSQLSTFSLSDSTRSEQLKPGTYYLVVDNTDYGPTRPPFNFKNDIATIDLKVTAK